MQAHKIDFIGRKKTGRTTFVYLLRLEKLMN